MDELKKIFLAGVGMTSTSIEKAEKLINEMVEKGRVTVQEGKELQTELTRKASGIVPATKAATMTVMWMMVGFSGGIGMLPRKGTNVWTMMNADRMPRMAMRYVLFFCVFMKAKPLLCLHFGKRRYIGILPNCSKKK